MSEESPELAAKLEAAFDTGRSEGYQEGLEEGFEDGVQAHIGEVTDAIIRGVAHLIAAILEDESLDKHEANIMVGCLEQVSAGIEDGSLLAEAPEGSDEHGPN